MRIGRPADGGRSRREVRREKEAERARIEEGLGGGIAPRETVKPKTLKKPKPAGAVALPNDEVLSSKMGKALPGQKVLLRTSIRPMQTVDIIMPQQAEFGDNMDVRKSTIHDIVKRKRKEYLVIAQPQPAISKHYVGETLEFTFLNRYRDGFNKRWIRTGYSTPLLKIIKDHKIGKSMREDVIVVAAPKKLESRSLRLTYRIVPPDDLDLKIMIWPDGTELGLMDLSMGGSRFFHDRRWHFPIKSSMSLRLTSGDTAIMLNAQVVRHDKVVDRYGRKKAVTCVEFYNLSHENQIKLQELITGIYRHLLAQRSGAK